MGSTFTVELPVYKRVPIRSRDGSRKSLFSIRSSVNTNETPVIANAGRNTLARSFSSSHGSNGRIQVQSIHSLDNESVPTGIVPDMDKECDINTMRLRSSQQSIIPIFTIQEHQPQSLLRSGNTLEASVTSRAIDALKNIQLGKEEEKKYEIDKIIRREVSNDLAEGLRVLIVDDAKMNRKMLCRLLKYRCDVTMEAEDGQRAVEEVASAMARGEPFNCILMDFNMPRKDGPTAAREIRSMGYTGMIIGITGCTLEVERDYFICHGADCVLTKPVDLHELDRTILGMDVRLYVLLSALIFYFQNFFRRPYE